MQYLNETKILCLTYAEFVPAVLAESAYKLAKHRGNIKVHGRGGNGNPILIEYETLPERYKNSVKRAYGDPYKYVEKQPVLEALKQQDEEAIRKFYTETYELPNGETLPPAYIEKYTQAAVCLETLIRFTDDKRALKQQLGMPVGDFWLMMAELIRTKGIDLPTSDKRLRERIKAYKEIGLSSLVEEWRFGNDNTRKVNDKLERVILQLYAQDTKPYEIEVYQQLEQIRAGKLSIVDEETGELYGQEIFLKNGKPITVSLSAVKACLNIPVNRAAVEKKRNSNLAYRGKHRPHAHRTAPEYAFSKLSMDDIAVPFKMGDGKRAWSYQVFDVASGCVVGASFSKSSMNSRGENVSGKNKELLIASVRDMIRLLVKNGWGMPAEVECEQHIANTLVGSVDANGDFQADLLTAGEVFPFVRFCQGGNPQEKRAEGFIKAKKYKQQNKRKGFQRRPFARLEANRLNEEKNTVRYDFKEIVENEWLDIHKYNHSLHPNQEKYPGLTRWEVLVNNINPKLGKPNMALLMRYIGNSDNFKVQRNQFVKVRNQKFALPSTKVLHQLTGLSVTAYFLEQDGQIPEVYLYQKDKYICKCKPLTPYQEAQFERTDTDKEIMQNQFSYINSFDTLIKDKVRDFVSLRLIETDPEAVAQDMEAELLRKATDDAREAAKETKPLALPPAEEVTRPNVFDLI